ncbi:acyl-ACP--UDP-N-acetylglucosamine O-acyltransferase [Tundrisphaera lichenicola]|uniref:acyl-ACP--UDP-N-acetylglucosamine O-acyltransferase n=1 Tax=Tundrisphaera lichenicola TaxID=2029860 RepID=UPI003EBBC63E
MSMLTSEWIHPTAVIAPEADVAHDVQVGPYSIIEGPVTVGQGTIIEGHACLSGPMVMGRDNFVGHGAVLGKGPQHRGYRGEPTLLRIGDENVFREHVTIHRGTVAGGGETSIGDRNLFMIGSHLGHDGRVGNDCTLVNGALVGGHVELNDGCILSGHCAIQQRVRVGRLAMLGGLGSVTKDIPPFVLQQGYNCVSGLNLVGLRRAGLSSESITALRVAFRVFYKEGRSQGSALDLLNEDLGHIPEVSEFVEFIRSSALGVSPSRDPGRTRRAS